MKCHSQLIFLPLFDIQQENMKDRISLEKD